MRFLKTTLTVIGAATVLVLAGNTISLAATGHALLLGKSNSANANTSITRTTAGSVLKLQSKSSSNSPLTVNGKGKVANLNADQVDGKSASAFAAATSVPIARGFVNTGLGGTSPTLATGSTGVSAVSWNASDSNYVLTVTGQSYYYNKYVTMITGTCDANIAPGTSSLGGKLLVVFGTGSACNSGGFAYVIYKIA